MAVAAQDMRVCVVGCGAVGVAVRRPPGARSPTSRSGPTTSSRAHVEAINRDGLRLTGAGRRRRAGRARPPTPPSFRPASSASSRPRRCTPRAAIAATAHAFADGAVASVQNGIGNEEVHRRPRRAGDPRHDLPGRAAASRPASSHMGRRAATRGSGPFEAAARADGRGRRGSPRRAPRGGMPTKALSPTRAAPQWRKLIFNAATNPLGRADRAHPRPRSASCRRSPADRLAARRRGQGGRGAPRGSRSTPTPRS